MFFTSIAGSLCAHFKHSPMSTVPTPRAKHNFVLQDVNADFVRKVLLKLKSKKATDRPTDRPCIINEGWACIIDKPIAHLINLTFSTSVIPTDWKEAKVMPIYKSGKKNDVNNYRAISVFPQISKLMERAVQIQLVSFLSDNNILYIWFPKTTFYRNGCCPPS